MAEIKTRPTAESVEAFLAGVENNRRRADAQAVCALMARVTGRAPVMWGPAIVGFGRRQYAYADGRKDYMLGMGFSPRKADLTLYMWKRFEGADALMAAMSEIKQKGSCLHVKNLDRVDLATFEDFARRSWAGVVQDTPQ